MGKVPYCYREDGSFQWKVFFSAAQIRLGLLLIAGGLGCSAVITRMDLGEGLLSMVLPMLCCLICLMGVEQINSFLGRQRAMKAQKEKNM